MNLAEEKANELIERFRYMLLPFISFQSQLSDEDLMRKCRQCAAYCVEQIISEILDFDSGLKQFYKKVLEIINNKL